MRWSGLLGLLCLASTARAADWSDFTELFAAAPCADGWSACSDQDAEPLRDATGAPTPADQRVGWFDLEATAAFTPWVHWEPHHGPEVVVTKARPAPPTEPEPEPAVAIVVEETAPPEIAGTPEPEDHQSPAVDAELRASVGKLTAAEITALEETAAFGDRQTARDEASRMLLVNAWESGDRQGFMALAKRHLQEIDQSDPDLVYRYAVVLGRSDTGRWRDVVHWSGVALENRHIWTGDTYQSRVSGLYKLRCGALQSGWSEAEQAHAIEPGAESKGRVDSLRAETKVCAREWLEYERMAGRDTVTATQLCTSAAGTADYCR